ncbi:MAG: hypothetical protein IPM45_03220 [Acidimicrobiales bacterium]|nr:hypothetical protein [Acidimicrobiales bacterium]
MAWREGGELARKTWGLVKEHRVLLSLVVQGAVVATVMLAVGGIPAGAVLSADDASTPAAIAAATIALVAVYLATLTGMVFAGAVAWAADRILAGHPDPTSAEARSAAMQHLGALAGWAAITMAVGWLLSALRGDGGGNAFVAILRLVVSAAIAVTWAFATLFAVPAIVLDGVGPIEAIKRSARLFKERWGTEVSGTFRLGVRISLLFVLPGLVLLVAGVVLLLNGEVVALGVALAAAGVALLIVGGLLSSTVRAVFGVAMYRYAEQGESVGVFSAAELAGAVRTRR